MSSRAGSADSWWRRARAAAAQRFLSRRGLWIALRVSLSVGLLVYVFSQIELVQVLELAAGIRLELLALACALVLVNRVLAAYRWYILLRGKHPSLGFWPVLRLIWVSGFVGVLAPGTVGVEALRIYGLTRSGVSMPASVTSVLVERTMALIALILLALIGLASQPVLRLPELTWLVAVGFAGLVGGTIAVLHPAPRRLSMAMLPGRLLAPVRQSLSKIYVVLDDYKTRPRLMLWSAVATLAFQLLRCLTPAFTAAALGISVPITFFLLAMPILFLVMMAPISIAGLGVLEAGFVYLFGLTGVSSAAALSLALLTRVVWLSAMLPGAWLYARGGLWGSRSGPGEGPAAPPRGA